MTVPALERPRPAGSRAPQGPGESSRGWEVSPAPLGSQEEGDTPSPTHRRPPAILGSALVLGLGWQEQK